VGVVIELLVRRCAWCDRVWGANGWHDDARVSVEDETATVCPACVDWLRASGLSR
jgi:hypothetical protein